MFYTNRPLWDGLTVPVIGLKLFRAVSAIRGIKTPVLLLTTSSAALALGASVPMSCCASAALVPNNPKNSKISFCNLGYY